VKDGSRMVRRGRESNGSDRIACGGGVDSMLQLRLESGCGGTKRCRKLKWR
jgi:hypothetical protein